METNKNIWNKKMDELTVKDVIIVNAALPIITIGGLVAGAVALDKVRDARRKFRTFRENRKNETNEE